MYEVKYVKYTCKVTKIKPKEKKIKVKKRFVHNYKNISKKYPEKVRFVQRARAKNSFE